MTSPKAAPRKGGNSSVSMPDSNPDIPAGSKVFEEFLPSNLFTIQVNAPTFYWRKGIFMKIQKQVSR